MFTVIFEVNPHSGRREDCLSQAALLNGIGTVKAVTLTEGPGETTANPGTLETNRFDSITGRGNGRMLYGWPDLAAAEAGTAGVPGSHRVVTVIRDYGIHARTEAPRYYLPIQRP